MAIPIDRRGRIDNGPLRGHSVAVESQEDGGFAVIVADGEGGLRLSQYMESFDALNSYFRDQNWRVIWD